MKAMEIEEYARQLWETSGAKAVAEAARKVRTFEEKGDKEQVKTWLRIEAALMQMKGPRES